MSARAIGNGYVTLFSVTYRHDYYNADGGICRDLSVRPTPATADLMASLGMLAIDQGIGFAVAVQTQRLPALAAWLRGEPAGSAGAWTRLSFLVSSPNPGFLGITNLPLATSFAAQNLYASNLQTVMPGKTIELGQGNGMDAKALTAVTGASLTVAKPATGTAKLSDVSGAAISVPTQESASGTSYDLSSLPYDRYALTFANAASKPIAAPRSWQGPAAWLYVPQPPQSLALLDLMLMQPAAGQGDPSAFPITLTAGQPPAVSRVDLVMPFGTRGTYWNYYVVAQGRGRSLGSDLQIGGGPTGLSFKRSNAALPNGDAAMLFTASDPLPLQQRSTVRLTLAGQRHSADGARDAIKLDWLPSAPPTPVWPPPRADPLAGSSEIYVYV
jgi:hypothetical protein